MAGLTAGYELAKDSRFDVLLLEARDRIGGRVLSRAIQGCDVDLGGFMIFPWYRTYRELCDELGLECLPSDANFTMHRINGDLDAYIQRMADAGVRVGRPFPPMLEWSRLSYGLPEEQNRWAETLKGFRAKGWV